MILFKHIINNGLKNNTEVKKQVPKKLYWGQADWFFDGEGIGLHYRANEISKDAPQLDIYLTTNKANRCYNLKFISKCFNLLAEFRIEIACAYSGFA
jgi:hypothetical protein